MVFFIRDYSGSMSGKPTEVVVTQHILIYSWLLYQYEKRVVTRFILHDTDAKEVPDFYTYYSSNVAGGTRVASAYRLVNEIVEAENLARDYNIYVFQGTDGDDWDTDGRQTIPEIEKILEFTNRVGITIAAERRGNGSGEYMRTPACSKTPQAHPYGFGRRKRNRGASYRGHEKVAFLRAKSISLPFRFLETAMELIDQHTKRIMEGCKERAREAGLRFDDESLEYIVTNRTCSS